MHPIWYSHIPYHFLRQNCVCRKTRTMKSLDRSEIQKAKSLDRKRDGRGNRRGGRRGKRSGRTSKWLGHQKIPYIQKYCFVAVGTPAILLLILSVIFHIPSPSFYSSHFLFLHLLFAFWSFPYNRKITIWNHF